MFSLDIKLLCYLSMVVLFLVKNSYATCPELTIPNGYITEDTQDNPDYRDVVCNTGFSREGRKERYQCVNNVWVGNLTCTDCRDWDKVNQLGIFSRNESVVPAVNGECPPCSQLGCVNINYFPPGDSCSLSFFIRSQFNSTLETCRQLCHDENDGYCKSFFITGHRCEILNKKYDHYIPSNGFTTSNCI